MQHAVTHYNTLQYTCNKLWMRGMAADDYIETHCNTLQHTATHCNTLQHTATHCNTINITLQHAATRCNMQQHAAKHLQQAEGDEHGGR